MDSGSNALGGLGNIRRSRELGQGLVRDPEGEHRPSAWPGSRRQFPSVSFHNPPGNGESESQAGRFGADKGSEDVLVEVGRQAGSGVCHANGDPAPAALWECGPLIGGSSPVANSNTIVPPSGTASKAFNSRFRMT